LADISKQKERFFKFLKDVLSILEDFSSDREKGEGKKWEDF
jgi:hypothetical protein